VGDADTTEHLWTPQDRRDQLRSVIAVAQWIKRHRQTDAYDEILAACEGFLADGFTASDLKLFSRSTGVPGWTHPRSDERVDMEMADPQLVERLDLLRDLLHGLRTIGYR
jgi:hypothetical protein